MQRAAFLLIVAILLLPDRDVRAEPPAKTQQTAASHDLKKMTTRNPSLARLIESANGWMYVNGEWVHPDGYKFVNNKVLRTTAKSGKASSPKPPGKLALENPTKLIPRTKSTSPDAATAAEKAAEQRRKNLEPRPASQTGTHL